jgi:hypothetical protein
MKCLEEVMEACLLQKREGFLYDEFHQHMLRCIENLTHAASEAEKNPQAIFWDKKHRGSAVSIANVIVELFAVAKKYDLPMERAFDIVMNRKTVKV